MLFPRGDTRPCVKEINRYTYYIKGQITHIKGLKRALNRLERVRDGGTMSARIGRGLLLPLPGDELRPHRALAAPVLDTGDGADVLLAYGIASLECAR